MRDIEKIITPFVESQFPSFYQEEGPLFILFVKEYYKWLCTQSYVIDGVNIAGAALYHSRSLPAYRDIDKTADDFLVYFKEKYLKGINFNAVSDRRTLIKAAHDLFISKGSSASIDILFNLLYGIKVEIYSPGSDVFRCSNAKWVIPKYLEVTPTSKTSLLAGKQVTGSKSGASAFVEYVITRNILGKYIDILFLSSVNGEFLVNDIVTSDGIIEDAPRVIGSFNSIDITQAGEGFEVGEEVNITSYSGIDAKAFVSSVESATGLVRFQIIDGGWGYSTQSNTIVSEKVIVYENLTNSNTSITTFSDYETVEQNNFSVVLNNVVGNFTIGTRLTNHSGALSSISSVLQTPGSNAATLIINPISGNTFANTIVYTANDAFIFTNTYVTFSTGQSLVQSNGTSNTAVGAIKAISNVSIFNVTNTTISANGLHVGNYVYQPATLSRGQIIAIPREIDHNYTGISTLAITNISGSFDNTSLLNTYSDTNLSTFIASVTPTSVIAGYKLDLEFTSGSDRWSSGNTVILKDAPLVNNQIVLSSDLGGKYSTNTSYKSEGVVIGSNSTAIGIVSVSNTFYGTGYDIMRGKTSNSYAYVTRVSTGSGADFSVGNLGDAETVLLSPDLISGNNDGPGTNSTSFATMLISGANSTYNNLHAVYIGSGGTGYSNTDVGVITYGRNINAASLTFTTGAFVGITAVEGTPTGIYFKYDGTQLYFCGSTADKIHQYTLSTPWSVNTATYTANISVGSGFQDTSPQDIHVSPDGKFIYMVGTTNDRVYKYTLSTPWSLSTATFTNFFSLSSITALGELGPTGVTFKPDGSRMYVCGTDLDDIFQFDLSVAWDITTASLASGRLDLTSVETVPQSIRLSEDGIRLFITGSTNDRMYVYDLTTPWDISTATFISSSSTFGTISANTAESGPLGIYIKPTGDKMYLTGSTLDRVIEYNVANAATQSFSNATIQTDASGTITLCTLGATNGTNVVSTPIITIVNSSGGVSAGSGADLIPVSSLGFVKNRFGDITYVIYDLLRFDERSIGTITSLTGINPGENYNLSPFIVVNEPYVSAYGKRDIILDIKSLTVPTGFSTDELVVQTISSPAIQVISNTFTGNTVTNYDRGEFATTNNGIDVTGTGTIYSTTFTAPNYTTILSGNTGTFNNTQIVSKLTVSTNTGFTPGVTVTQGAASGTLLTTNTTTMIITGVTGSFAANATLITGTGSSNATVSLANNAYKIYQLVGSTTRGITDISSTSASTADSNARGRVKSSSNLSSLSLRRTSLFTEFLPNYLITGLTSGCQANVVFAKADEDTKIIGLNANIVANVVTTSGSVNGLTLIDSGYSFIQDQGAEFTSVDGLRQGSGKINIGGIGTGEGYYSNTNGLLDGFDFIHDGEYYQEFSYEVQSTKPLNSYYDLLKRLLHVAGTKMFGKVVTSTENDLGLESVQSSVTIT